MEQTQKSLSVKISRRIARAVHDYGMIEPGSRILIGISGGKDSMTLLYHMGLLKKSLGFDFEYKPIHIRADFDGCPKDGNMEKIIESWGEKLTVIDVPVVARLKPGKKMNCYWCSTQRRMEMLKYAGEHGFDSIALGHHQDDIIETFIMNMAYKGELSTMLPVMQYDKYPQKVIRPLALVKEQDCLDFTRLLGISSFTCTCPYGQTSKRLEARDAIELLAKSGKGVKERIFQAMHNVIPEYLPRYSSPETEDME